MPPLQARQRPSTAGYGVAAIVAVLGLTAAVLWGAVGIHTTGDRVDGLARLAVPGATTVSVSDPGALVAYHDSAAEVAGSAEPTATGRLVSRWDPGTRTIVTVGSPRDTASWQRLGLSMTGPGRVAVPVADRSGARYDLEPGRAGRAVATVPATTAGPPGCRRPGPARPGPPWRGPGPRPQRGADQVGRGRLGVGDGVGGGAAGRGHLPARSRTLR